MKITITMEITDDDLIDEADPSGLTEAAWMDLNTALSEFGDDIDIKAS